VPIETLPALQRIGVAVLIGLLIGLDRERSDLRGSRLLFAGVRTFPLIAVAGALPILLGAAIGPLFGLALLIASFVAIGAIALVSYVRSTALGEVGATTEIAALATFLLGALAGGGQLILAGATGVLVAVLLASKPRLEGLSRALSAEELVAVLELAVISVIVLPLLPRRGYGPWEVLNPFEIWLVVVLVTALSFAGFVAMRLLGERRGLTVTGIAGGLVSSTAVTLSMAERSRGADVMAQPVAAAAIVASSVMCLRVAVVAGVVASGVLPRLIPILAAMALVGFGAAAWLGRAAPADFGPARKRLPNPFSLRRAMTFGAIYALVRLAVRAAQEYLGGGGMLAAAFVSGLADMDAPTIALARGGALAGSWRVPAAAIGVAAIANTLAKLGLAIALGSGAFRRFVAIALGAVAIAGAIVTAAIYARP